MTLDELRMLAVVNLTPPKQPISETFEDETLRVIQWATATIYVIVCVDPIPTQEMIENFTQSVLRRKPMFVSVQLRVLDYARHALSLNAVFRLGDDEAVIDYVDALRRSGEPGVVTSSA